MDTETELIRTQNWTELKRFYSSSAGHSWELAWVYLLRSHDSAKAIEEFSKSIRDPRYETASFILLWKLGQKPSMRPADFSPSLRLFEAYENSDFSYLIHFIEKSKENEVYLPALFSKSIEKMSAQNLHLMQKFTRSASFSFQLGYHADRRLKDHDLAAKFYGDFLSDAWSRRVLEEARKHFLDAEKSRMLQNAYAQHDGVLVQRILKASLAKLEKVSDQSLPEIWRSTLCEALNWELKHTTENIFGFPFWKKSELSPSAISLVQQKMFSPEKDPEPVSLSFWKKLFLNSKLEEIPATLDPDFLPLWQIRVELNSDTLSEALLRFPNEERFLLLWSVRQREVETKNPKRWPANEKESNVVRKNLERAFDRSNDKVLWFDRLRKSGCSQDFYEYAISKIPVPVSWVLDDLKNHFITTSANVRIFLRDQLCVQTSESSQLSSQQLLEAISYLTPAETQQVLLSRSVISEIPHQILNDEFIDLFWDAKQKVSDEVFSKWLKMVLKFIQSQPQKKLEQRHWQWIELAWDRDPATLASFPPPLTSFQAFPWEIYIQKLNQHENTDQLLQVLSRIPEDRLKETAILELMLNGSSDQRVLNAIHSMKTDYIRHSLLATWYENKGEYEKALHNREAELQLCPIINEQLRIAREALNLYKKFETSGSREILSSLLNMADFLEKNGGLEAHHCREISEISVKFLAWEPAWKWTIQEWNRSSEAERLSALDRLLDIAFQARAIEEAQRLLIESVFQRIQPNPLTYEILNALLDPNSAFRIRHLRKEFLDRASQIYPLHFEVLKSRAAYDYRAVLLWDSFYGEDLEVRSEIPSYSKKRRYELWGLTESLTLPEVYSKFTKYLNTLPLKKADSKLLSKNAFVETAKRLTQRLTKSFQLRDAVEIRVLDELEIPFRVSFSPYVLEVKSEFFEQLDEEMWSALSVGVLQVLHDRERGLFDEKRLAERFFQGMLLSGSPMAKLLRFWVWLAIHEEMITPTILKSDPENVVDQLPFVKALLIFFLSTDFENKMEDCGFVPN
ncbi:MAG: hypothetical protein J0L93_04220 [Deltaproteobacteria bacterium]|nr:hypothetical protein [Deltaproteobacteria bacterium]